MGETKDNRTTIRLPDDLKKLLQDEAKKQNRSVHNLMLTIMMEYFKDKDVSSKARD